ncbi:MAG: alpha/beta hydrolase [Chitinophagaceae bacterium]
MFRLILAILLFLCSLLTIFLVPARQLWYLAVAVTEFSWVFLIFAGLTLVWSFRRNKFRLLSISFGILSMLFFLFPIVGAWYIGRHLDSRLEKALNVKEADLKEFHQQQPYSFTRMFTGTGSKKVTYSTYQYAVHTGVKLTLDHYPAQVAGIRPCLVVVHGGSWSKGNSAELPDVNSYFANAGYHVVTINYRLAPQYTSPAPQEDLQAALRFVRQHAAELRVDTNNFILTGRSAGGQIVLAAAYTLSDPGIKGVISFYGPTDMLWSYDHPTSPLIMNSKKVLRDFVGGAPDEVPGKYLAASAFHHVTASTIPTLLIHGRNDAHVFQRQSYRLKEKLDAAGVKNFFLAIPWATHGCEYKLSSPSGQLSVYAMERFMYGVTQHH